MSIQAMAWVLEKSQARLGGRLALLSIANHADQRGGNAWPAVATIARESHMSRRQVQRCLQDLVDLGELSIDSNAGPRGTHRFTIVGMRRNAETPDKLSPPTSRAGDISDAEGMTFPTERGDRMSPEPSLTVQDPSKRESARAREGGDSSGRRTELPESASLTPESRAYAEKLGLQDIDSVFEKFRLNARSKGKTSCDWAAEWKLWCNREIEFKARQPKRSGAEERQRKSDEDDAAILEVMGLHRNLEDLPVVGSSSTARGECDRSPVVMSIDEAVNESQGV